MPGTKLEGSAALATGTRCAAQRRIAVRDMSAIRTAHLLHVGYAARAAALTGAVTGRQGVAHAAQSVRIQMAPWRCVHMHAHHSAGAACCKHCLLRSTRRCWPCLSRGDCASAAAGTQGLVEAPRQPEGGGPLTHLAQHARQVERLATALSLWERIMRHPIHTAAQAAHPQRCVRSARPRGARGAFQPATRRMGSPMRRLNIAAGAALGQPPL